MKYLLILTLILSSHSVSAVENKKPVVFVPVKSKTAAQSVSKDKDKKPTPKKPEAKPVKIKTDLEIYKETKRTDTNPSSLRKEFETTTGIKVGEYTLVANSNDACVSGRLGLADFGNEVGVILGSSSFIVGIGKDKIEEPEEEDGCVLVYKSSYKANVVEQIEERTCKDGTKSTRKTVLTIEKEKLSYTQSLTLNEEAPQEVTCVSTLDKVQPK